jgi:hypothetical protein
MTKREGSLTSAGNDIVAISLLDYTPAMFARTPLCSACKRPVAARLLRFSQNQYLHASPALGLPRRKDFFSSNANLAQNQLSKNDGPSDNSDSQKQRRHSGRTPAAPTSLRRVAVEAQRSKDGFLSKAQLKEQGIDQSKVNPPYPTSTAIYTNFCCHSIDNHCLRRSRAIQYTQSPRDPAREGL